MKLKSYLLFVIYIPLMIYNLCSRAQTTAGVAAAYEDLLCLKRLQQYRAHKQGAGCIPGHGPGHHPDAAHVRHQSGSMHRGGRGGLLSQVRLLAKVAAAHPLRLSTCLIALASAGPRLQFSRQRTHPANQIPFCHSRGRGWRPMARPVPRGIQPPFWHV